MRNEKKLNLCLKIQILVFVAMMAGCVTFSSLFMYYKHLAKVATLKKNYIRIA